MRLSSGLSGGPSDRLSGGLYNRLSGGLSVGLSGGQSGGQSGGLSGGLSGVLSGVFSEAGDSGRVLRYRYQVALSFAFLSEWRGFLTQNRQNLVIFVFTFFLYPRPWVWSSNFTVSFYSAFFWCR